MRHENSEYLTSNTEETVNTGMYVSIIPILVIYGSIISDFISYN